MKYPNLLLILLLVLFQSCIGDDIIQDKVEPTIRILNSLDSIAINTTHQFEYIYRDNVGKETTVSADWSSSDPSTISISESGLAEALENGASDITVSYNDGTTTVSDLMTINVGSVTVITEMEESRMGTVNTTSSYALSGDFTLEANDADELILSFSSNYNASSALPGLFIYLTNNPNTTEDALEIGAVTTFSGAHEYNVGNVDLFEYSHVLYFCKPFNVKVGDGAIN